MLHRKMHHAGMIRQVRSEVGIDLLRAYESDVQHVLASDPVAVVNRRNLRRARGHLWRPIGRWCDKVMDALVEFFLKSILMISLSLAKAPLQVGSTLGVVFRASGIIGQPPWDYSMRELIWAAQGVGALGASSRDQQAARRGKSIHPETINPWHPRRPRATRHNRG